MNDLIIKLKAAVMVDPKRAGLLGALLVVLAVMCLRLTLGGTSPRAAVASTIANLTGTKTAIERSLASPTSESPELTRWLAAPIDLSDRNLFAVRYERFPQDGSRAVGNTVAEPEGFWDELAKSMSTQADVKKRRQYLVENVQRQAASLKLQSTLMNGQHPRALINGTQVGEGDVVATASGETRGGDSGNGPVEFRVLKIEARRIIVEREGVKLEIQMN
jgi:hypothetical protein